MSKFEEAQSKSKYGRRDWVYWRDRAGQEHIAVRSVESLKTALLACGTKGDFRLLSGGLAHIVKWRMGLIMLRNARAGH